MQLSVLVDYNVNGVVKLPLPGSSRSCCVKEAPFSVELLDSGVVRVSDVHVSMGADTELPWIVNLPFGLSISAPACEEFSLRLKLLHAVIVELAHVDVTLPVHGNADRC